MITDYDTKAQERRLANCFVAVVGSENEHGAARDSIQCLRLRPGDSTPTPFRGAKGYEARQKAIDTFLNLPHFGCILMLDADMIFQPDTLERLRSHGLPYISGIYPWRAFRPLRLVWQEAFPEGEAFPMKPFTDSPEHGKLYEIGGSGWGCVLIHREVFDAMKPILKGEPYVIEDDMDIYPYDLQKVMGAINEIEYQTDPRRMGEHGFDLSALRRAGEVLRHEIIPLRADKADCVGSDVRFPFYAQKAGYPLIGDPDVRCAHVTAYPITVEDFDAAKAHDLSKTELYAQEKAKFEENMENARRKTQERVSALYSSYLREGEA